MERIIFVELEGKTYPMAFTMGVAEYVKREKGDVDGFAKTLSSKDQNITAVIDVGLVMIRQGIKKYIKERGDIEDADICLEAPTREDMELLYPDALVKLMKGVIDAIMAGKQNTVKGRPAKGAKKNEA